MSFIALAFDGYQPYLEPKDSVLLKNHLGKGELEGNGHKRGAKIVHLEFGENPPVIDRSGFGENGHRSIKSHPGQFACA
jgi:hypothetical protein